MTKHPKKVLTLDVPMWVAVIVIPTTLIAVLFTIAAILSLWP